MIENDAANAATPQEHDPATPEGRAGLLADALAGLTNKNALELAEAGIYTTPTDPPITFMVDPSAEADVDDDEDDDDEGQQYCWACEREIDDVDYACQHCGLYQPDADPGVEVRVAFGDAWRGLQYQVDRVNATGTEMDDEDNIVTITDSLEFACIEMLSALHQMRIHGGGLPAQVLVSKTPSPALYPIQPPTI